MAALNESELGEYCRKRGLYPEQIQAWHCACEQANDWAGERSRRSQADQDHGIEPAPIAGIACGAVGCPKLSEFPLVQPIVLHGRKTKLSLRLAPES